MCWKYRQTVLLLRALVLLSLGKILGFFVYPAQSFTEPRQRQSSCLKAGLSLEGNGYSQVQEGRLFPPEPLQSPRGHHSTAAPVVRLA